MHVRQKVALLLLVCTALFTIKCVSTVPAIGISLNYNGDGIDLVGKSTETRIFGIFSLGDRSITAAMQQGGIAKIHHVDIQTSNFIIAKIITTIVTGEGPSLANGKSMSIQSSSPPGAPKGSITPTAAGELTSVAGMSLISEKKVICQYTGSGDFTQVMETVEKIKWDCGTLNKIPVGTKVELVKTNSYVVKGAIVWNADCYFVICSPAGESIKVPKGDIVKLTSFY